MTLEELGYYSDLENYCANEKLNTFSVGRVISEHKERYVVKNEIGEYDSELIGNLRFNASSREDFPAVGDWVAISEYDDDKALIHNIYPRKSIIQRQAVGKFGEKQIIATNIDYGLIVQAVDRDFNINRLERYLTICNASNVKPIIVLSKIDLIEELELKNILDEISKRINNVLVVSVSNATTNGYNEIAEIIESGVTYCLLGSSGVGKSTLLNNVSGKDYMKTGSISLSVNKGKHVTSHRELIVLENGGILIDNPGLREVGIVDTDSGLELTFDTIMELSNNCKFADCTHIHKNGCAILEAIENGELEKAAYENYLKMEKEKAHFDSSLLERRNKDKAFGKMIKRVLKEKKLKKY